MENIIRKLKENGIKATHQRIAVYRALLESGHLSAWKIFEKVRRVFPTVSYATVYAILDVLRNKGMVEELHIIPECACFHLKEETHHHFYCKRCKSIFNIHIPLCPSLAKKDVEGNLIEEHQGTFYGICKSCRTK